MPDLLPFRIEQLDPSGQWVERERRSTLPAATREATALARYHAAVHTPQRLRDGQVVGAVRVRRGEDATALATFLPSVS